jgi:hypothetical protein
VSTPAYRQVIKPGNFSLVGLIGTTGILKIPVVHFNSRRPEQRPTGISYLPSAKKHPTGLTLTLVGPEASRRELVNSRRPLRRPLGPTFTPVGPDASRRELVNSRRPWRHPTGIIALWAGGHPARLILLSLSLSLSLSLFQTAARPPPERRPPRRPRPRSNARTWSAARRRPGPLRYIIF